MKTARIVFFSIPLLLILLQCNDQKHTDGNKDISLQVLIPNGAIPFEFDRHIVLHGKFNDSICAKWVFDTGCPYAVIDSTYFVENGFSFENAIPAYSLGAGNSRTRTHILESDHTVMLDTFSRRPSRIYLIDLRKAVGDKKADGILQVKYFGDAILEVNYQDEYLIVHDRSFVTDSSWARIPFEFTKDRRIYLDAWIEVEPGLKVEGTFLLDLGSGGSFGISAPTAKSMNLSDCTKETDILDMQNGGIGGGTTVGLLYADECGLGPFSFEGVPIMYSTNVRGALGTDKHHGIIGNMILSRFHLILDFSQNCMFLKPNKLFADTFNRRDPFGLLVLDRTISEGGFKVNGLVRKSGADSAGFLLGDIITHIDTIRFLPDHHPEHFYHVLDSLRQFGSYSFRVNRGGKVQNIVAD